MIPSPPGTDRCLKCKKAIPKGTFCPCGGKR
jgi:hypothetical protein